MACIYFLSNLTITRIFLIFWCKSIYNTSYWLCVFFQVFILPNFTIQFILTTISSINKSRCFDENSVSIDEYNFIKLWHRLMWFKLIYNLRQTLHLNLLFYIFVRESILFLIDCLKEIICKHMVTKAIINEFSIQKKIHKKLNNCRL